MARAKQIFSLIGPPGSGKGSYGRHLAEALNLSLVGVSSVLKELRPGLDLSSGALVDDAVVTDALQDYFHQSKHDSSPGFLLDGFPRTSAQIDLTTERWSPDLQLQAAIKLNVPDFVCEAKLLGRRTCTKCHGNFNVNGVDRDGWDLPPFLPPRSGSDPNCSQATCADQYWVDRPDDTPEIIRDRLETYHHHMDPILNHFEELGRLLKLTPYHGYKDIDQMIQQVRNWIATH